MKRQRGPNEWQKCEEYIQRGGRFYGNSRAKDSARFGKASKTGAKYDSERNLWYAPNADALRKMLATGAWWPMERINVRLLARVLEKKHVDAQKAAAAKAAEAAAEAAAAAVPTAAEAESHIRSVLHVPNDPPELLDEIYDTYGVNALGVQATVKWALLGPRSGLSDAARLMRGVRLGVINYDTLRAHVRSQGVDVLERVEDGARLCAEVGTENEDVSRQPGVECEQE